MLPTTLNLYEKELTFSLKPSEASASSDVTGIARNLYISTQKIYDAEEEKANLKGRS